MTSSDIDMLRLEAPATRLQITDGQTATGPVVEIARPASWLRALVAQHEQAQIDLRQLYQICGGQFDQTNAQMQLIERAYDTLYRGTQYIYEQAGHQQEASREWMHTELSRAANAYQTFSQEVWQAIVD
jgi:hypothetical protein